jgi:hypothetical protein
MDINLYGIVARCQEFVIESPNLDDGGAWLEWTILNRIDLPKDFPIHYTSKFVDGVGLLVLDPFKVVKWAKEV